MVMDRKAAAPAPLQQQPQQQPAQQQQQQQVDSSMSDNNPTPTSVGREFVRQYYTLLNQAPLHLHRFYSHNSTFIHGDVDQAEVVGQKEIHAKIQQLDFRECYAKIVRVDAHATIGDGVVIQVKELYINLVV